MIVLITGGASGLGENITRVFADQEDNQVFFTYNHSVVKAEQLMAEYGTVHAIRCDFKNPQDVTDLMAKIPEISPDVLINNAYGGSFLKFHFHKLAADDFLADFKENIISVVLITQQVISCFRKKKGGKIITILTSALTEPPPVGSAVYVANKAYLKELSRIWSAENAKFNIVAKTISPSFMLTNFTAAVDERIVEQIKESSFEKKLLDPKQVAAAIFSFVYSAGPLAEGLDIPINRDLFN